MADRFELFRISLVPKPPDLLTFSESPPSREEYLRLAFSRPYSFNHYGTEFHYRPDPTRSTREALLGKLGRPVVSPENLPPDQGFEETTHPGWRAAVIALDPTDHPDGQKLAVQDAPSVAKPYSLVRSFMRTINEGNPDARYVASAQPIFDAQSFWRFAEEHHGNIVSLTFELTAPNGLWSTHSSIQEEMSAFRDALNVETVTNTFKGQAGINTDDKRVKDAVEYAENGSGKINAISRDKKRFSSTKKAKRSILEPIDSEPIEPLIVRAARRISEIFGRE